MFKDVYSINYSRWKPFRELRHHVSFNTFRHNYALSAYTTSNSTHVHILYSAYTIRKGYQKRKYFQCVFPKYVSNVSVDSLNRFQPPSSKLLLLTVPRRYSYLHLFYLYMSLVFWLLDVWLMHCVWLYVNVCLLHERWMYALCCVACMSLFLAFSWCVWAIKKED